MTRRRRARKAPPKVAYTLLTRKTNPDDYDRLDRIVDAHHADLRDARIAIAFCNSWRDDSGKIGQMRRASALDRELMDFDLVVLVKQDYWTNPLTTDVQKDALLDHELCHATTKDDANGDPLRDERDRIVYKLVRHDVEEFACIVDRYGFWKRDLERFAQSVKRKADQPPLPMDDDQAPKAAPARPH
jgi:hypothetical protein